MYMPLSTDAQDETGRFNDLMKTARLIADAAKKRGWKVDQYYPGSSHLLLAIEPGKAIEIYSATPPQTSYIAAHRADDKYATHQRFASHGLPVPETYFVTEGAEIDAAAETFLAHKRAFVIKPFDAGHGNGVTVAVTTMNQARDAAQFARQFSDSIIVQEYIAHPIDVRVLCIGYTYQAALIRHPARIKGDGKHTIRELVERENQQENRGQAYRSTLGRIDIALAERYLGAELAAIAPDGVDIQVVGTANVGTGGETEDVTDDIPDWLRLLAESAAKVAELPVCGVDILLSDRPKGGTAAALQPKIIEINKCPALFIHEQPTIGNPQDVVSRYLDYLEVSLQNAVA
jgi:cyanophycin synthetase